MQARMASAFSLLATLWAVSSPAGAQSPFDWIVPPGTIVVIDTADGIITGGDGEITGVMPVANGVIDVRNVSIPASAEVQFVGAHPVVILASGDVVIDGRVSVSGQTASGVVDLFGPSFGGSGHAGGGAGADDPHVTGDVGRGRGEHGEGAFGRRHAGGRGGESSFHPSSKNARRGAGGGGGRFGHDTKYAFEGVYPHCQSLIGLDSEPGFRGGSVEGTGALSQSGPARGGRVGLSPFRDDSRRNDFYGLALSPNGLVVGELDRPWAGSGGGAGGRGIQADMFPAPITNVGGGGGGGAGSLSILAMGELHVGLSGSIKADGGAGSGGANANFIDRVGGAGGGGSGGHIILQSASRIRIDAVADGAGDGYLEPSPPSGTGQEHPPRPISAVGGQGGAGRGDVGGDAGSGPIPWKCDAIPFQRLVVGGVSVPPLDEPCFQNLATPIPGQVHGAGGDGGPGLIQLHVPDPTTDLIFGGISDGDLTKVFAPPPYGWREGEFEVHLLPLMGAAAKLHQRLLPPSDASR